jgi:hypothetical protein
MTSSIKAGTIRICLGLAIAPWFPPAFRFFSIAVVLSIVAMATHTGPLLLGLPYRRSHYSAFICAAFW